MAYKNLIDSNVKKAFNLLKDLAVEAVLYKKLAPVFNFSTGEATVGDAETINIKVVITGQIKSERGKNVIEKVIMLKSKEVGDLSFYDTITINNIEWRLGEPIKSDGFVLITSMYREE
jgi:mannose/fructose/N-acetylgalactosamine-specific phosphotransferase system component IIB